MFLPQLNSIEPPWYGPVCPVVWEGWHREVSPYPDQCPEADVSQSRTTEQVYSAPNRAKFYALLWSCWLSILACRLATDPSSIERF